MNALYFFTISALVWASVFAAPTPEEACNSELGKCKEYCKAGGKDEATCTSICNDDNGICLCSTKCQATDGPCIEKCYRAVDKYCENNLPVCVGFCMTNDKKDAPVCNNQCNTSKTVCLCQKECKDDKCKKACLPPAPA